MCQSENRGRIGIKDLKLSFFKVNDDILVYINDMNVSTPLSLSHMSKATYLELFSVTEVSSIMFLITWYYK